MSKHKKDGKKENKKSGKKPYLVPLLVTYGSLTNMAPFLGAAVP
ncbi:MAG TPA: hypothetical protein VNK24_01950 [Elusimicrobiota bacterium]|nr:hypothetical protein [Elusimicrobiota bacterium]